MSTQSDRPDEPKSGAETAPITAPITAPRNAARNAASKPLTPAAQRALAEAAARRAERDGNAAARPGEVRGPKGLEPTRYGDWERKGLASDF